MNSTLSGTLTALVSGFFSGQNDGRSLGISPAHTAAASNDTQVTCKQDLFTVQNIEPTGKAHGK